MEPVTSSLIEGKSRIIKANESKRRQEKKRNIEQEDSQKAHDKVTDLNFDNIRNYIKFKCIKYSS